MKFGLVFVIIAILIALCQPQITFSGAVSGLNIWFFQLLPTLLPFMILSNILLSDPVQEYIFARMSPLRAKKIRILFAVLAGLTFGLPIGAKMAKDLYQKNRTVLRRLLCPDEKTGPSRPLWHQPFALIPAPYPLSCMFFL